MLSADIRPFVHPSYVEVRDRQTDGRTNTDTALIS